MLPSEGTAVISRGVLLFMYTLCYHSIHKWLVKKPSFSKAKNISNRKKNELSFSNCHWGQKKKGYRGGKLQERRVTVSFVEFYFHLVGKKKKRWTLCWNTWEKKKKRQLWFTWEFLLWAVLNWPILTMHELGRQDISASQPLFRIVVSSLCIALYHLSIALWTRQCCEVLGLCLCFIGDGRVTVWTVPIANF